MEKYDKNKHGAFLKMKWRETNSDFPARVINDPRKSLVLKVKPAEIIKSDDYPVCD